MKAGEARRFAAEWVTETASRTPGFEGAFLHGSINEMPDDAPFPATSDVDVGVVVTDSDPLPRIGKTRYRDLLVEGAVIAASRVRTAEQVLADASLAHSFRVDSVIADPTGHLGPLQREVAEHFAERAWVLSRCRSVERNCLRYVGGVEAVTAFSTRALCFLFAAGNLAHVVLVAALRNPTVRRRYAVARDVLAAAGLPETHERLLEILGCARMTEHRVEAHLSRMTRSFDRAAALRQSEFPFGSDVSPLARDVAVDGSRDLIARGLHREAVFWIGVTFARCLEILQADAPVGDAAETESALRELMEDLDAGDPERMRERAAEVGRALPSLLALARDRIAPRI